MRTTQAERDELRGQMKRLSDSNMKLYVCGTTTNVDMLRLLDDADRAAELEDALQRETDAHSSTIRRFNALLNNGCTA